MVSVCILGYFSFQDGWITICCLIRMTSVSYCPLDSNEPFPLVFWLRWHYFHVLSLPTTRTQWNYREIGLISPSWSLIISVERRVLAKKKLSRYGLIPGVSILFPNNNIIHIWDTKRLLFQLIGNQRSRIWINVLVVLAPWLETMRFLSPRHRNSITFHCYLKLSSSIRRGKLILQSFKLSCHSCHSV